jgi:hypothetical protein
MKFTFYELRMLRTAINDARLTQFGERERTGTDGDLMVKEWIADRHEDNVRPSVEWVCEALTRIRDARDHDPQYSKVEIQRWDALLGKLCQHQIDLDNDDRTLIVRAVTHLFDPGVGIDIDHWVNNEREDLCEALKVYQAEKGKPTGALRRSRDQRVYRRLRRMLGCAMWMDPDALLHHIQHEIKIDVADWLVISDGILIATVDTDCEDADGNLGVEDCYGVIHYGSDGEQKDSLWGMDYGGSDHAAMSAILGYVEQMGWVRDEESNLYRPPSKKPPTRQKTARIAITQGYRQEDEAVETAQRVAEPLSPKEEGLIDSMLRLGWYKSRDGAVAHIMRMRKAHDLQRRKLGRAAGDGRLPGLDAINIIEAARYRPRLMRLPSWGSR